MVERATCRIRRQVKRSRTNYEEGRCVAYMWLPSKEEEAQGGTEKLFSKY